MEYSVIEPMSSWGYMLKEAQRWVRESISCFSAKEGRQYWITKVSGEGINSIIRIEREADYNHSNMGFRRVRDFLLRFENQDFLQFHRDHHRLDVANVTVIVNLHPYLTFSEEGTRILVLTEPKSSIPNSRMVDQTSEADRQKNAREIRQGQAKFRSELLDIYEGRCCITGTNVKSTLDASHILPYASNRNSRNTNGLLLRADVHNLFDDGLIRINPATLEIVVHKSLIGTVYEQYNNKKILNRKDGFSLDSTALEWHFCNFK